MTTGQSTMTIGQTRRKNRKSSMLMYAEMGITRFMERNPTRVYFTVNEIWTELTPNGKKIIARKGTLTFILGRLHYRRVDGFLVARDTTGGFKNVQQTVDANLQPKKFGTPQSA